jgi:hypothetical protein
LRHRLLECVENLRKESKRISFRDRETYLLWLAQAYFFVKHSTPLLALSCGRSINRPEYHLRCISHLAEERGHDRLLLQDLTTIGAKIEDCPELSMTSALYQTQYFWIEHRNPVSFLGYIFVLEALAVMSGAEKILEAQAHGATKFLQLHAAEDVEHLQSAIREIEKLPKADQLDILANANLTSKIYAMMLSEISEVSTARRKKITNSTESEAA